MNIARKAFSGRSLLTGTVSLIAMGAAQPAFAACNQTGADIECTGNTPGPVVINQDGVTVTVEQNAVIDGQNSGEAISIVGDGNTIDVDGALQSGTSNVATLLSQSFSGGHIITNNGTITASGTGFTRAIDSRTSGGNTTITNAAGGIINTSSAGISGFVADGALTITNAGRIAHIAGSQFQGSSQSAGITAQAGSTVTSATPSNLAITNTGTIDATAQNFAGGIYASTFFGSQTIRNDGQINAFQGIEARYGNAATSITNTGTINAESQGLIVRRARSDVSGGQASSVFVNNSGTIIANRPSGGTGVSILDNDGVNLALVNTGRIEATSRGVNINSTGSSQGASIENSGQIIAGTTDAFLVQMNGGPVSINNTGRIDAQTQGEFAIRIVNAQAQVLNSGTLIGHIGLGSLDDMFTMLGGAITGEIDGGDGDDTFVFDVTGPYVHDDLVANFETVTINGDVVFDSGTIRGANTITLTGGSALSFAAGNGNAIATVDTAQFVNEGTLTIDPGFSFSAGDTYVATDGSTTRFVIDDPAQSAPVLFANGDVTFDAGSTIEVDARDQNLLVNGQVFDAVIAGGSITDLSGDIVDNSMLFDFSKLVVAGAQGDSLQITVRQILQLPDAVAPGDPNAASVAGSLQDVIDSGTPAGNQIATALGQIGDPVVLADAIDNFGPGEANAVLISAIDSAELQFGAVHSRSSALSGRGLMVWGNVYASNGNLDAAGARAGFASDRMGFVAGADIGLGDEGNLRAGLAFSTSDGKSDELGNRAVDSDQSEKSIFAYITKTDGKIRISASLGSGWGSVDSSRDIAILSETAIASFDTSSTFGRFEIGRAFENAVRTLTPYAAIQFVDVSHEEFAETGSVAALSIAGRSATSVRADLGIDARFGKRNESLSFVGRLAVTNEFGELAAPVSAVFAAGGPAFSTQVQNRNGVGGLGEARLSLATSETLAFEIGYEGRLSGGYDLHAVRGSVSIKF